MTMFASYTTSNILNLIDEIYKSDRTLNNIYPLTPKAEVVPIKDDLCSLEIELPGFSRDQIKVYTEKNILNVEAEKTKNSKTRKYYRYWPLSQSKKVGKIKYENGVLMIEIQKVIPEEHRRKEFSIE